MDTKEREIVYHNLLIQSLAERAKYILNLKGIDDTGLVEEVDPKEVYELLDEDFKKDVVSFTYNNHGYLVKKEFIRFLNTVWTLED